MAKFVFLVLLFLVGTALADDRERCARLFIEPSAVSTCRTFLGIDSRQISDADLRESISKMVYGKSAADADSEIKRREDARKLEELAEKKKEEESQCGRLFVGVEERSACRTLSILTMRVRSDIQMIDAVRERLGRPPLTGPEREIVIRDEGSRQEAFVAAQKEKERVDAEKQAALDKELAKERAIERVARERKRAIDEENNKKPIPGNWKAFSISMNPADQAHVSTIKKMKWWDICRDYGREVRSERDLRRLTAFREYLLDQDLLNGIDISGIRDRRVAVGMSTCGVIATLGMPTTINNTTTATRTTAQMVYRDRGMYVYTEARPNDANGIVRTIQH